jgi:1,4-alpha-glucan branching enzyme
VSAPASSLPASDREALVAGTHDDPFRVLGPHGQGAARVVRAFVPGADTLRAIGPRGGRSRPFRRLHPDGLFEGAVPGTGRYTLEAVRDADTWTFHDPYAFGPLLGPTDEWLIGEGTHEALFDRLGAHLIVHEGVPGTRFAVWAPNARRVSVIGDFNQWDGRRHPMRRRHGTGVWELFLPHVGAGALYKFELIGADGTLLPAKADPMGFAAERRPATASVVCDLSTVTWHDDAWMAARATADARRAPMAIYEVHAGSWRRHADGGWLSYDELADGLIPYVTDLGFTHLELLPVSEHPFDGSWGYQPVGLFAPTSRFGDPAGFARFVDRCHQAGLGVILDWVPAHFPTDPHGLARFDGTALYEHEDPRRGFHPDWHTAIYNLGRREVANLLIANALFWCERYHIDGLRVDAVASMLYLDYSRPEGGWLPNAQGGRENLESVAFLRRLTDTVHTRHPGVLVIAEESTAWPKVSHPTHDGGLGFDFKWNMGWMHDTLQYLKEDPVHRRWHHDRMTFGLVYAFSEAFILPLSHDEVVHGKGALVRKAPGDDWQRLATLRAYYAFMWGHPGKKLLFMGGEFGQDREWDHDGTLDWAAADAPAGAGLRHLVRDANRLLRQEPALHCRDGDPEGFQWLAVDDRDHSVFAWVRHGGPGDRPVVVVANFTPVPRLAHRVGLPLGGAWAEVLNSDAAVYGGSNVGNGSGLLAETTPWHGCAWSATVQLPPLATLWLVPASR